MEYIKSPITACRLSFYFWKKIEHSLYIDEPDVKYREMRNLCCEWQLACPCCDYVNGVTKVGRIGACFYNCPMSGFWRGHNGNHCNHSGALFHIFHTTRGVGRRREAAANIRRAAKQALEYWLALREMNQQ